MPDGSYDLARVKPKQVTQRDYQSQALRILDADLRAGHLEVALCSPTGSGKSLLIQALTTRLHGPGGKFRLTVVCAPQLLIMDNLRPTEDMQVLPANPRAHATTGLLIKRSDWNALADKGQGRLILQRNLLGTPSQPVMLTTAQALVTWHSKGDLLPDRLDGCLLVVDEGHHASKDNGIGGFCRAWKARGGAVLYATATPYRRDGTLIYDPNKIPAFVRTMAQHAAEGFAPAKMPVRVMPLDYEATDSAGLRGDKAGPGGVGKYMHLPALWDADAVVTVAYGRVRPKAVFIVPEIQGVAALVQAFEAVAGKGRVLDATGTGKTAKDDTAKGLADERKASWSSSTYDVVIACKRFDEGTDWPLCSHVYMVGLSSAFASVVQRWGRAMRLKHWNAATGEGVEGYPAELSDTAMLTFLIPHANAETWDKYERQHNDHAFMLACFLESFGTAQSYLSMLLQQPLPSGSRTPKADVWARVVSAAQIDEQTLRDGVTWLAKAEVSIKRAGGTPTMAAVASWIEARDPDEWARIQPVHALFTAGKAAQNGLDMNALKKLRSRIAKLEDGGGSERDLIHGALREAFDEVVSEYAGDVLCDVAGGALIRMAEFSGRQAQDIARDLGDRLAGVPGAPLSEDQIAAAIVAFQAETGKLPSGRCADSFKWTGVHLTWAAIDQRLPNGLSRFLIDRGFKAGRPDLTEDQIADAIVAFHAETGRWPSANRGDSFRWTGVHLTWLAINHRLPNGLRRFRLDRGFKVDRSDLPEDQITNAVIAFQAETGKLPTQTSGLSFKWTGTNLTWQAIDRQLPDGLSRFLIARGFKVARPDLTRDQIANAAVAFQAETGKLPTKNSGDSFRWTGANLTWQAIDQRLPNGLYRFLIDRGLKVGISNLTEDQIANAAIAFHAETGKWPTRRSGDSSRWTSVNLTWFAIDARLPSGLHRFFVGRGLKK